MKIVSRYKKFYPEIVASLMCLSLGMVSGFVSHASDSVWYQQLDKPFFNPPSWIFAPVWTILYCMMGAALGILWRDKHKNKNLISLFCLQFLYNFAWSPLFFYAHRIDIALLDLLALWVTIITFMIRARRQQRVFMLFVPYLLWVTFALILNLTIFMMNYYVGRD